MHGPHASTTLAVSGTSGGYPLGPETPRRGPPGAAAGRYLGRRPWSLTASWRRPRGYRLVAEAGWCDRRLSCLVPAHGHPPGSPRASVRRATVCMVKVQVTGLACVVFGILGPVRADALRAGWIPSCGSGSRRAARSGSPRAARGWVHSKSGWSSICPRRGPRGTSGPLRCGCGCGSGVRARPAAADEPTHDPHLPDGLRLGLPPFGQPWRQAVRIRSRTSGRASNPAALYVATPPALEDGVHTRTLDEPISRSAAAPATVIARP